MSLTPGWSRCQQTAALHFGILLTDWLDYHGILYYIRDDTPDDLEHNLEHTHSQDYITKDMRTPK